MTTLIARVLKADEGVPMIDGAQVQTLIEIRDVLLILDDQGRTWVANREGNDAVEVRGHGKRRK